MSEIPSSKVNFTTSDSVFKWDTERQISLFERNTLPKLKCETMNLLDALDSYKKGDTESYTKLMNSLDKICELRKK